ncbi:hypothetical protein AVEN_175045-1 [Araneus ventricosus]|uniref:Uncharacterized protein n=1 Tax=Araneus ventricosus TaxID=182803 RepID=A0A4Y2PHY3_ARAVE|nr:hypothetical protein AVEN_175045-1 [Araneus ventricosus]
MFQGCFITGHGPFPSYLFQFGKPPDNCCARREPGTPLLYATKCRLTHSYHLRCPADQHIEAWMKLITNHHLLRNKIIDLLNFITSQEDLLNRNVQNNSTIACIVHPTTKLTSPTTPLFSFLLEHSMPERDHQFQCLLAQPHVHHTSHLSSTASCKSTRDYSRMQSLA